MAILPNDKTLLIPNKAKTSSAGTVKQSDYGTDMRTIEQWAKGVGGGVYASLTGAGETTSPGELDQNGDFTAISTDGLSGIVIGLGVGIEILNENPAATFSMIDESSAGLSVEEIGTGPIHISADGGGGFILNCIPGDEVALYVGTDLASMPTPASVTPSFGFSADGHLLFYPTGGPWSILI